MNGLTPLIIEYAGVGSEDAIDFGYLPDVSNLAARSISAWIYATAQVFNNTEIVTYGPNYRFTIDSVSGSIKLTVVQTGGPGATALWSSSASAILFGQWVHVVLTHDVSTWPNNCTPIIYVDGSSVSLSNPAAAGGTKDPETGSRFVVGNVYETFTPFTGPFKGKIKDVRVYNNVLSVAKVTTLRNGGVPAYDVLSAPEDGLLFQGFAVRTEELTPVYLNLPLSDTTKVRDNIFSAIGSPHGSPVGRTS